MSGGDRRREVVEDCDLLSANRRAGTKGLSILQVKSELKRQDGSISLRLPMPAPGWLYRGEFPVPVSIRWAEPPDSDRDSVMIEGREGHDLKLQL